MTKNLTVKEIKKELTDLGVDFDESLKKDELSKILVESQKKPPEYVVVEEFKDLEDNSYVYFKDDPFPRKDKVVDESRIEELASKNNKRNKILIKEQE